MEEISIIVEVNIWIAKELSCLERKGYIFRNRFITNSVSNFISSPDFGVNNLVSLGTDIIPIRVQIPNALAWNLNFNTIRLNINSSDIINTALGHSIPVLLEEIERIEA